MQPSFDGPKMKRLKDYLLKDEMPIWLSLLLAVSAAAGTYIIAPLINQEIEYQTNRSEHVSKTVNGLNERIVELSKSVRKFNSDLFYQKASTPKSREEVLDRITELQWLLIDVDAIIDREVGKGKAVDDLRSDLERLQEAVQNGKKPEDQETVIDAMSASARQAQNVFHELYAAARLI